MPAGRAGIGQIVVLVWLQNLVAYVCVTIVSTILGNLYVNFMVDRNYPLLRHVSDAVSLDKTRKREIVRNVKALSIHNMANFFVKNTDNIVLSYFLFQLYVYHCLDRHRCLQNIRLGYRQYW